MSSCSEIDSSRVTVNVCGACFDAVMSSCSEIDSSRVTVNVSPASQEPNVSPWSRWAASADILTSIVCALSGFPGGIWQMITLSLESLSSSLSSKSKIWEFDNLESYNFTSLIWPENWDETLTSFLLVVTYAPIIISESDSIEFTVVASKFPAWEIPGISRSEIVDSSFPLT